MPLHELMLSQLACSHSRALGRWKEIAQDRPVTSGCHLGNQQAATVAVKCVCCLSGHSLKNLAEILSFIKAFINKGSLSSDRALVPHSMVHGPAFGA